MTRVQMFAVMREALKVDEPFDASVVKDWTSEDRFRLVESLNRMASDMRLYEAIGGSHIYLFRPWQRRAARRRAGAQATELERRARAVLRA